MKNRDRFIFGMTGWVLALAFFPAWAPPALAADPVEQQGTVGEALAISVEKAKKK